MIGSSIGVFHTFSHIILTLPAYLLWPENAILPLELSVQASVFILDYMLSHFSHMQMGVVIGSPWQVWRGPSESSPLRTQDGDGGVKGMGPTLYPVTPAIVENIQLSVAVLGNFPCCWLFPFSPP